MRRRRRSAEDQKLVDCLGTKPLRHRIRVRQQRRTADVEKVPADAQRDERQPVMNNGLTREPDGDGRGHQYRARQHDAACAEPVDEVARHK